METSELVVLVIRIVLLGLLVVDESVDFYFDRKSTADSLNQP